MVWFSWNTGLLLQNGGSAGGESRYREARCLSSCLNLASRPTLLSFRQIRPPGKLNLKGRKSAMTANAPKQLASPFSTGGGGDDFQFQVGAYYLAGLLLRHVPRGLDAGTLTEVRFQRLYEGEPLDDLVCVANTATGPTKLPLQMKNDLTFGEKDELFEEVVAACWRTYTSPNFARGRDRFGIVLGVYKTKVDEHYQTVLTWARNSSSAGAFLGRVGQQGLSHKNHREFVALIRSKLGTVSGGAVSDDDLWGFLRSMVILHFDLLAGGSRDATHAINCLQQVLQPGGPGAAELFSRLRDISAEANRTAGEYTYESLASRLQAEGFRLVPSPDCREDLARLDALRDHILDDIRTDIGGLALNRVDQIESSQDRFTDVALLLLTGPPGGGKSGAPAPPWSCRPTASTGKGGPGSPAPMGSLGTPRNCSWRSAPTRSLASSSTALTGSTTTVPGWRSTTCCGRPRRCCPRRQQAAVAVRRHGP
jgi:hypothetical protein